MFTLHVYYLTFISGCGGEGGGVTGEKVGKPVMTVLVPISTFVNVKRRDIFGQATPGFEH